MKEMGPKMGRPMGSLRRRLSDNMLLYINQATIVSLSLMQILERRGSLRYMMH